MEKFNKKIVIVGSGVAGINAATKLVDNGYPGELINIIDKGSDPYNRQPEEVMTGFLGCGGWSDGKLTYHTAIGGDEGQADFINMFNMKVLDMRDIELIADLEHG